MRKIGTGLAGVLACLVAACGDAPPASQQPAQESTNDSIAPPDPYKPEPNQPAPDEWDLSGERFEFPKLDPHLATVGFHYDYHYEIEIGHSPLRLKVDGNPPEGLSIQKRGIHGTPTKAGKFKFTITVIDLMMRWAQGEVELTVVEPAVFEPDYTNANRFSVFGASTCRVDVRGARFPLISGGTVVPGTEMPDGVRCDAYGTYLKLSGYLKREGTFQFKVYVAEATGRIGEVAISLTSEYSKPEIPDMTIPDAVVGEHYVFPLPLAGVNMNGLRAEVEVRNLSENIRDQFQKPTLIDFTPKTPGEYKLIVRLKRADNGGVLAEREFPWRVLEDGPPIVTHELPPVSVGDEVNLMLTVSKALRNVTWTITEGELPPGCKLETLELKRDTDRSQIFSTPRITGTPTQPGSYTFTVQGTYRDRPSLPRTLTLEVKEAPSIYGISVTGDVAIRCFTMPDTPQESIDDLKTRLKALVTALPEGTRVYLTYSRRSVGYRHTHFIETGKTGTKTLIDWIDAMECPDSGASEEWHSIGVEPSANTPQFIDVILPGSDMRFWNEVPFTQDGSQYTAVSAVPAKHPLWQEFNRLAWEFATNANGSWVCR